MKIHYLSGWPEVAVAHWKSQPEFGIIIIEWLSGIGVCVCVFGYDGAKK